MKYLHRTRLGLVLAVFLATSTLQAANAPDFNLSSPEGKRINLKKLLKKGPVLLNFWATYCKPCIKAMPKLQELHNKYKNQGFTVLGVNEDGPRGQARVKPFLRGRKVTFLIAIDGDGGVMKRLQVRSLPTTILIAPDGEIVLRQAGYTPATAKPLLDAIELLMAAQKIQGEADADK